MTIGCAYCNHRTSNKESHISHMKDRHFSHWSHHDKLYVCGICGLAVTQKSYVRHVRTVHRILPTTSSLLFTSRISVPGYICARSQLSSTAANTSTVLQTSTHQIPSLLPQISFTINYEAIRVSISKIIEDCDIMWMNILGEPKITKKMIANVSSQHVQILRSSMSLLKHTMPLNEYEAINSEMEMYLKSRQSEYLRIQILNDNPHFLPPICHTFSYRRVVSKSSSLKMKGNNIAVVPMEQTLKVLFSNRNLCEALVYPSTYYDSTDYTHPFCGQHTKTIFEELGKKDCIFIQLFADDFCPVNPLGAGASKNKIMGCYFKVLNIPYELQTIDNMYLAFLAPSDTVKSNIQKLLMEVIVPQLKNLKKGIPLFHNGVVKYFPVILHSIVGDNLGIHQLSGFLQAFRGSCACRFCRTHSNDFSTTYEINPATLKTYETYNDAIATQNIETMRANGITEECALNSAPNFHVMKSQLTDIMHDLPEGHMRRLMAEVIKSLITVDHISLERINNCIATFPFDGTMKSNRPSPIVQAHLDAAEVKGQTATMMINLATMLPIILKLNDITVSPQNRWWTTFKGFLKMWNILMMQKLTNTKIEFLQQLIKVYLTAFHLNGGHFTVKTHIPLHYVDTIKLHGPLLFHWCMRWEGKHKQFKDYAKVNSNHTDLAMTLARRQQMIMVSVFSDLTHENYRQNQLLSFASREYKIGIVVAYDYDENQNRPLLGYIKEINLQTQELLLQKLKVLHYSNELFAYVIEKSIEEVTVLIPNIFFHKSVPLYGTYVRFPCDLK